MQEYYQRLHRVRTQMGHDEVDYLVVGPSSDLLYLTGYQMWPSERLTLLILSQQGPPRLILPRFELPRFEKQEVAGFVEPVTWTEVEDPLSLVASVLSRRGNGVTIAVGDHLHAHFLLGLQDLMPRVRYVRGERVLGYVRMCKSEYELEQMRATGAAADAVFLALLDLPLTGRSEVEILGDIRRLLTEKGNDSVGGGIVAIGSNSASPHHRPGNRRAAVGDTVLMDFSGVLNGYRSDISRTIHIGPPSVEFRQVYDIVKEANQKAFEAVAPGVTAESVDTAAREFIEAAGFGPQFLHRIGHGIGLDAHEHPYVVSGNRMLLEEGMTFSIEPGIYLTGRFGVRIEDIVVVTGDGAERLNQSTHELQAVSCRSAGTRGGSRL